MASDEAKGLKRPRRLGIREGCHTDRQAFCLVDKPTQPIARSKMCKHRGERLPKPLAADEHWLPAT